MPSSKPPGIEITITPSSNPSTIDRQRSMEEEEGRYNYPASPQGAQHSLPQQQQAAHHRYSFSSVDEPKDSKDLPEIQGDDDDDEENDYYYDYSDSGSGGSTHAPLEKRAPHPPQSSNWHRVNPASSGSSSADVINPNNESVTRQHNLSQGPGRAPHSPVERTLRHHQRQAAPHHARRHHPLSSHPHRHRTPSGQKTKSPSPPHSPSAPPPPPLLDSQSTLPNQDVKYPPKESGSNHQMLTSDHLQHPCEKEMENPAPVGLERQVLRKIDLNLLPLLGILYLFSYLDRVNIGNARLYGMEEAVHLDKGQFNIALAVFFVTYTAFELPSNLVLLRLGPHRWIPSLMVMWGLVSLGMAWVTSFPGLVIARFFLGAAEAGFVPGVYYYLTLFYKRSEISLRMAIFLCFNILAGCTGGLIAAAISKLDGALGLQAWQWVFIVEAIPTLLLAVVTWCVMVPSPAAATFLTPEERQLASDRTRSDFDTRATQHTTWQQTKEALLDYKVWMFCFITFTIHLAGNGVVLYLPSLIKDLGYTSVMAQLLTAPPYIVAACVSLLVPWWSDKIQQRAIFICCVPVVSIVGFIIMAFAEPVGARYFAAFLILIGVLTPNPLIPAWLTSNTVGHTKRASSLALLVAASSLGGVVGTQVYREPDAPRYRIGHLCMLGAAAACIAASLLLRMLLAHENKRRDQDAIKGLTPTQSMSEDQLNSLGDNHPDFRYTL